MMSRHKSCRFCKAVVVALVSIGSSTTVTDAWVHQHPRSAAAATRQTLSSSSALDAAASSTQQASRTKRARDLVQSLVVDQNCFSSEDGALAFAEACAANIVYEDRFLDQPVVGKTDVTQLMLDKVAQRQGRGLVRLDRITDGDRACGFAWTWTTEQEEGLRGTTFVELSEQTGEIQFVCEIPEPIFKPGNATKDLLQAVTQDAAWEDPRPYEKKQPTVAHELAKYLFEDLSADRRNVLDEVMDFFAPDILYRDFNYEDILRGKDEVRQFVKDHTFPGIEFRPLRYDDGVDSTCFTWEVVVMDAPDTVKGMSFYELDPATRKIAYVRDVPESAIKPPILGKLARDWRPGLGVFQGVPLGSRPGGM